MCALRKHRQMDQDDFEESSGMVVTRKTSKMEGCFLLTTAVHQVQACCCRDSGLYCLALASSTTRSDVAGLAATLLENGPWSIFAEASALIPAAATTSSSTATPTASRSESSASWSCICASIRSGFRPTLFDIDRLRTDLVWVGTNGSSVALWCLKFDKGAVLSGDQHNSHHRNHNWNILVVSTHHNT